MSSEADVPKGAFHQVPSYDALAEAVKAGWRLKYFAYSHWACSGGPDACRHGIAKGIPCERCDEHMVMTMNNALHQKDNE